MKRAHWDRLESDARRVVEAALNELPPELQAAARAVPCLFQEWCEDDPDLLGIYSDFSPGEMSEANGPIILYLAAIEDFCLDEDCEYADEVRLTFLHELGHHFGWDEGDLEERGLG
jgi:predicted Zn-dependent protease with MMP-like domain